MSKDFDVSFSELPEQTFENPVAGIYILKITDIIKEDDPEYGMKYTMTHEVVGAGRKINYDNYKIFDKDGKPEVWGQGKLRKLIEALGLTSLERINVKVLQQVAKGEMFKAEVDVTDKGYMNIKFSEIFPLSDPRIALNEPSNKTVAKDVKPEDFKGEASTAVIEEINDDDI